MSDGGKGSGRRPGQGYQDAWERIFGTKTEACPKCGNEEFEVLEWSPKQGVEPYATYNECHCGTTWSAQ